MSNLEQCIEILEEAGFDVLDVGCAWHKGTAAEGISSGLLVAVFAAASLLVCGFIEWNDQKKAKAKT